MQQTGDFDTWLALAKCWQIWDLDVRGFHKRWAANGGDHVCHHASVPIHPAHTPASRVVLWFSCSLWRLYVNTRPVIVVGTVSEFAVHKPVSVWGG